MVTKMDTHLIKELANYTHSAEKEKERLQKLQLNCTQNFRLKNHI